jgi:anthranilate phosphoribosyltransferase
VIEGSPGSLLQESGLLFLFAPHWKNAFSLLMHRQRNSLAKRKPDENGVLLK